MFKTQVASISQFYSFLLPFVVLRITIHCECGPYNVEIYGSSDDDIDGVDRKKIGVPTKKVCVFYGRS